MKKHDILEKAKKTYELLDADPAVLGQTRQAAALIEKLEKKDITVSIIGQFKRGKSSLSNKILEDEILPVGIVPITSAVTKVVYGKRAAEVHFFNGVVEEIPFDRLSEFISEQENSDNRLGVGSFHKNNTETAYHYMKESDAVIFLLSVDSPINQIEIDFLQSTREFAGKFYFAVNKTDIVGEADLTAYMDYCGKLLCHMMQVEEIAMFPVSARTGDGIEALKKAILRDCKKSAEEILTQSAEKKLRDVINSALIQLDFYWKAMNMEYKELDERFAAVSNTVEEIKASAADIDCLFEIHLNEMKLELSQQVKELFGCSDLEKTLSGILLYREENAYAVVRRINGINKLSRSLRKIRDDLTGCSV